MSNIQKFTIENREMKTIIISKETELDVGLRDFLLTITMDKTIKHVVSLDIEKEYSSSTDNKVCEKVAILKLCCGTTCLIIQLLQVKSAPISVSKFLQIQELTFVGVGIKHCLEALEKDYGIKCRNAVDLRDLAATVREREIFRAYGLVELADLVYPLIDVNKVLSSCYSSALSNWSVPILSKKQIEAATRSALLCFLIGNDIFGGSLPSPSGL